MMGVQWFGYGRFTETLLAVIAFLYGWTLMFFPHSAPYETVVTWDLASWGRYLAIPFLIKSTLTGSGLVLNGIGYEWSKHFRCAGAVIGIWVWTAIAVKLGTFGDKEKLLFLISCVFSVASVRVVFLSLVGKPIPGPIRL